MSDSSFFSLYDVTEKIMKVQVYDFQILNVISLNIVFLDSQDSNPHISANFAARKLVLVLFCQIFLTRFGSSNNSISTTRTYFYNLREPFSANRTSSKLVENCSLIDLKKKIGSLRTPLTTPVSLKVY